MNLGRLPSVTVRRAVPAAFSIAVEGTQAHACISGSAGRDVYDVAPVPHDFDHQEIL